MKLSTLLRRLGLTCFVAIDLETTGLKYHKDAIIEIAGIQFQNGKIVKKWTSLVNPHIKISDEIQTLTGINNSMLVESPSIQEILPSFFEFIGELPLVGHNVRFDLDFLKFDAKKLKLRIKYNPIYDTLTLARMCLYSHHSFTLESLNDYFSLSTEFSHRATTDAENTGKIFLELINEISSHPLSLIQEINQMTEGRDILNQKLFKDIVESCVVLKKINGLTRSKIKHDLKSPLYKHNGSFNLTNMDTPSSWFEENGLISDYWKDFEHRESQSRFSDDIAYAFRHHKILLAEAGAGLGKSLAYLSAGIFHKLNSNIPLVVSTYTKHLQDQLFYKDIPAISKILNIDLKAVLYKGRHNYICKTRLKYLVQNNKTLLNDSECELLLSIMVWKNYTQSGDFADCHGFRMTLIPKIWHMIRSEPGYCSLRKCKEWQGCFLAPIKDSILNADIIIVNHSLLLANLSLPEQTLPVEFNFVIDEGHNLVSAAQEQLILKVNQQSLDKIADFFNRKKGIMKKDISTLINAFPDFESIFIELEEYGEQIREVYSEFFDSFLSTKQEILKHSQYFEEKYVYRNAEIEFLNINPAPEEILESLNQYQQKISIFCDKIKSKKVSNLFITELELITTNLIDLIHILNRVFYVKSEDIVWSSFQRKRNGILPFLNCAPRIVSSLIRENIFNRKHGGVICSATLKFNNSFEFLQEELGLKNQDCEDRLLTKTYSSPFFFEEQMRLFTYKMDMDINSLDYLDEIAHQIKVVAKNIPRRILVLCTSFNQTKQLKLLLGNLEKNSDYHVFFHVPGSNRNSLIRGFLSHQRSILVGTLSFWEGVDLPGEKVEILMIIKIPFANPKEPMVIAQLDKYKSEGHNAFMAYSVPDATVRLKQGFGRLIRNLNDMGICIITDPRLIGKQYGKIILSSLPVSPIPYRSIENLVNETKKFFLGQFP